MSPNKDELLEKLYESYRGFVQKFKSIDNFDWSYAELTWFLDENEAQECKSELEAKARKYHENRNDKFEDFYPSFLRNLVNHQSNIEVTKRSPIAEREKEALLCEPTLANAAKYLLGIRGAEIASNIQDPANLLNKFYTELQNSNSKLNEEQIVTQLVPYIYIFHISMNQGREKGFLESPKMEKIFSAVVNNLSIFDAIYRPSPGHGLELLKNDVVFSYITPDNLYKNLAGYFRLFSAEHLAASFVAYLIKKNPDLIIKNSSEVYQVVGSISKSLYSQREALQKFLLSKVGATPKPPGQVANLGQLQKNTLAHTPPDQTWQALAQSPKALKELKTLIHLNRHKDIFKLLAQGNGDAEDKKIVLQAVLEAYSTKPQSKLRISWFNGLGDKKRALAKKYVNNHSDFNDIYSGLCVQHNKLATKAHSLWLFSNRWKVRTEKWDEKEHSEFGIILKTFKPK